MPLMVMSTKQNMTHRTSAEGCGRRVACQPLAVGLGTTWSWVSSWSLPTSCLTQWCTQMSRHWWRQWSETQLNVCNVTFILHQWLTRQLRRNFGDEPFYATDCNQTHNHQGKCIKNRTGTNTKDKLT